MAARGGTSARLGALSMNVNEASARELLATYRPDLVSNPIQLIDDGWEFLALRIGADLIARFPRRPEAAWKLGVEIGLLPVVAVSLSVGIPVAEFVARRGDEPLFGICRRIPGEALDAEANERTDVARTAGDVARALTDLHTIPLELLRSTGLPMVDASQWRAMYGAFARRVADGPPSERDEAVSRRVVGAIEAFATRDELFGFTPALIHADLGEQIFVEAPTGRVTGIIDWADAQIGDPAHDFGGLLEYGSDFMESVAAGYQRPDATLLERARFYDSIGPVVGFIAATDLGWAEEAETCWSETALRWG